MDKKLIININGTSKVDLDKIDLSTQARMFSGGVDSQPINPGLKKDTFNKILKKAVPPALTQSTKKN